MHGWFFRYIKIIPNEEKTHKKHAHICLPFIHLNHSFFVFCQRILRSKKMIITFAHVFFREFNIWKSKKTKKNCSIPKDHMWHFVHGFEYSCFFAFPLSCPCDKWKLFFFCFCFCEDIYRHCVFVKEFKCPLVVR